MCVVAPGYSSPSYCIPNRSYTVVPVLAVMRIRDVAQEPCSTDPAGEI